MIISCLPYDISPGALLELAKNWDLEEAIVIGFDKEGEFCIGGSKSKLRDIAWLLKNADSWINEELR